MAATTTTTPHANNVTQNTVTQNTDRATQNATRMVEETTQRMEQGSERLQELGSAMMGTTKAGSRVVLDSYAQTARTVFDLQRQMAGASQSEWVRQAATTQIQFAEDVTNAWIRAARALLK